MLQPNIAHLFIKYFKISVFSFIHWPLPLMCSPLFQTEIPFSSSSTQIRPLSWSQCALLSLCIFTEIYMFSRALFPYRLIQWLYVCIASPPLPLGTESLTGWLHERHIVHNRWMTKSLNHVIGSRGCDYLKTISHQANFSERSHWISWITRSWRWKAEYSVIVLIFSWTTYIEERSRNSPLGNFEMFLKDVKWISVPPGF